MRPDRLIRTKGNFLIRFVREKMICDIDIYHYDEVNKKFIDKDNKEYCVVHDFINMLMTKLAEKIDIMTFYPYVNELLKDYLVKEKKTFVTAQRYYNKSMYLDIAQWIVNDLFGNDMLFYEIYVKNIGHEDLVKYFYKGLIDTLVIKIK